MKKTLITAAALVACAGTQLFAQNTKQGVITVALTQYKQISVSASTSSQNSGIWEAPPISYKTSSAQLKTLNIIQAIGRVLHGNANYYSSKAQLVLVQGELSGFFNVTEELAGATPASFGEGETAWGNFDPTTFGDTTIPGGGTVPRLATGRHFQPGGPDADGAWPPGHHQPWGQIFVQDTGKSPLVCDNVTFLFAITIQECYDCFYLNSFISDATFKFTSSSGGGPPCCDVPVNLTGSGKDRYYMTLMFDNTLNNPYINPTSLGYIGGWGQGANSGAVGYNPWRNVVGLNPFPPTAAVDGLAADFLPYVSSIKAQIGTFNPNVLRFALNGIVTYTWSLKLINSSDVSPDFIGNAQYPCNGYGFVGLYCSLFTGTASIAEKAVKTANCCLDQPWYDSWYGPGWDQIGNSNTRATPINIPASLSYHSFFDGEYVPGEQWGSNPPSPTGDVP
jgi:hypothetical protein